jgi:prepilin-type N-terminal cleavage/methylation domain-containing protein
MTRNSNYRINQCGMTLLEVMIASGMIALLGMVAFSAMQSLRSFTSTNVTQVDLQENARKAVEFITTELRNAGRFIDPVGPREYPRLVRSDQAFPAGYHVAAQHPAKFPPKATPGSQVNGGDPTLPSTDIIFRVPGDQDGDGLPTKRNALDKIEIEFAPAELSFVVVSGPNNVNQIEYRNSAEAGSARVVARDIDRLQIEDYTTDPLLTTRQLRITVYLTRLIPVQGVISSNDPAMARQILTVAVSSIVDMRNASSLE